MLRMRLPGWDYEIGVLHCDVILTQGVEWLSGASSINVCWSRNSSVDDAAQRSAHLLLDQVPVGDVAAHDEEIENENAPKMEKDGEMDGRVSRLFFCGNCARVSSH